MLCLFSLYVVLRAFFSYVNYDEENHRILKNVEEIVAKNRNDKMDERLLEDLSNLAGDKDDKKAMEDIFDTSDETSAE